MYTPEEEETLLCKYDGANTDELAKLLGKSKRSIIGKLSAMIESELGTELPGLEKSPKETLKRLIECLK
jgi:hypothetical protein